ncbi:MAG: hypothetical protein C0625_05805 [Arcobacter sp.]|nr:MAG: hypothetical protein C0625_05805 [Arcobacter sp.]
MWKWLQKSKSVKKELFSFKDEPLTGLSIVLLIILDIFILTNIGIGIEGETNKAPKTYQYYPSTCVKHFKEVKTSYKDFYSYNSYIKLHNRSSLCNKLEAKINIFKTTDLFKKNLKQIKSLEEKLQKNNTRLTQIRNKYNTRLFEQIAKMPNNKLLNEIKIEYDTLIEDNKKVQKELDSITKVESLDGFNEYKKFVQSNKELFFKEKEDYRFWQPFKEYGYMLLFILPLILFFGFFYLRSKKKQLKGEKYNPIVKIITTHISFILILPVIWYSLTLIYHVIPKTLLKQIIEFLVSIGLLSILNYLSIALVVLFFGGLIYFIQKRTARLKQERIAKKDYKKLISFSVCFECEHKIDYTKDFCPYCGVKLNELCTNCNEKTTIHLPFCSTCGTKKES